MDTRYFINPRINKIIIENSISGFLLIDAKTKNIEYINQRACDVLGKPKDFYINKKCCELICPHNKDNCTNNSYLECCNIKENDEIYESSILKASGSKLNVLKSIKKIIIDNEEKIITSFVDITENKKEQQKIGRAHV